ncbi:MAG: zf-HC2 domain-containing protein [Deltaproteobacteria bacterium]|nr:zf-HC2 domain-containing protein [Deltaproteobacteria bacterium]
MDCERFEQHLMDQVFAEIDEVTGAAMKRHAESCARCRSIESGLRATVRVGVLPLEEPSDDLEERILEAARAAERATAWPRRLLRGLSWAGSHAMRPQLAMAAILVLVLGSSILLLRVRPGTVAISPVNVTERGAPRPAPAPEQVPTAEATAAAAAEPASALAAEPAAPAPAEEKQARAPHDAGDAATALASAAPDAQPSDDAVLRYERGVANYQAGKHSEAQRDLDEVGRRGGARAPEASLYYARSVRAQKGCQAAVTQYDRLRQRFAASPTATDAAWEQADCHQILGQNSQARALWLALRKDARYGERAQSNLASAEQAATQGKTATAAPQRMAAKAPAAPKAAAPAKAQGAKGPEGGSGGPNQKAKPADLEHVQEAVGY